MRGEDEDDNRDENYYYTKRLTIRQYRSNLFLCNVPGHDLHITLIDPVQ